MLIFSRRFKSSLVKAQASNALNNVIEEKKQLYELANFQTGSLKEYFDKNGLMFPVETIIEKIQKRRLRLLPQQRKLSESCRHSREVRSKPRHGACWRQALRHVQEEAVQTLRGKIEVCVGAFSVFCGDPRRRTDTRIWCSQTSLVIDNAGKLFR